MSILFAIFTARWGGVEIFGGVPDICERVCGVGWYSLAEMTTLQRQQLWIHERMRRLTGTSRESGNSWMRLIPQERCKLHVTVLLPSSWQMNSRKTCVGYSFATFKLLLACRRDSWVRKIHETANCLVRNHSKTHKNLRTNQYKQRQAVNLYLSDSCTGFHGDQCAVAWRDYVTGIFQTFLCQNSFRIDYFPRSFKKKKKCPITKWIPWRESKPL